MFNFFNTLKRICACVLVIMCFNQCASILSPESGPNILNSEPSGAEVYDANNFKLGETPLNLATIPQNTRELTIKKSGYIDMKLGMRREAKNFILFADAMLLCLPCPFDLSGNNIYSFSPKNPVVRLRTALPERNNKLKVAVDKVYFEGKDRQVGKINSQVKRVGDKGFSRISGEFDNLDETVKVGMNNSYIEPVYASYVDNIKSAMARPKVMIRPVITSINFDYKGKYLNDFKGQGSISCDWNIYKLSDKTTVVGTVTTKSSISRNAGTGTKIFDQMMGEATLDFLGIDSLYDFLQKLEKDYLSESKGNEIKINFIRGNKYESTKDALKNSKKSVVTVLCGDGFGSGFLISSDGYILTNYHVICDDKNISVKLNNDLKLKATLIKSNKDYDLALLHIDVEDMKPIPIGNSDEMETGDEVYAIGTPMDEMLGQSITKGIISGDRLISGIRFLQTDVSINPGNSGGPLINERGEMIGITTMKINAKGVEGIGFCIPSNAALEMLNIKN